MKQVSIIIPFIDGSAGFLEEAVESVLAQSYPHWELLLVNDGARGDCRHLARRYAEASPERIRCLEPEGGETQGVSAARNLGLRHAGGEYIAFLDADDVWLPAKLEEQVALLESQPEAGMLYGNTLYWRSWTGSSEDANRDYLPRLGVEPNRLVPPPDLLPRFLTGRAAVPCMCSVFLRREIVERVGGLESAFRGLYEDQVLYAKVSLEAPIYVAGACWDRYRQHPDAMTAVARRGRRERDARLVYLEWLRKYLVERGVADREVWRAVQGELWLGRHPRIGRGLKRLRKLFWRVGDQLRAESGRRP